MERERDRRIEGEEEAAKTKVEYREDIVCV
jgi:hypothetical protein